MLYFITGLGKYYNDVQTTCFYFFPFKVFRRFQLHVDFITTSPLNVQCYSIRRHVVLVAMQIKDTFVLQQQQQQTSSVLDTEY